MQSEIRPLTTSEFSLFRTLVESETGICLNDSKVALVNSRLLRRIRELGVHTFFEYYERVIQSPDDELIRLIDAMCTNETQFFREPGQFTFIQNKLIPQWVAEADRGLRHRRLRIWSAACSTGEEPYSVAMHLLDHLPEHWSFEILATDLSTKALLTAVSAIYPERRLPEVPERLRNRFLLKGVGQQEHNFRVAHPVRICVAFDRMNVVTQTPISHSGFDLLLCRNAMMYFHQNTRARVVLQLIDRLAPRGHLFVGHSESLYGIDKRLRTIIPTVYQLTTEVI